MKTFVCIIFWNNFFFFIQIRIIIITEMLNKFICNEVVIMQGINSFRCCLYMYLFFENYYERNYFTDEKKNFKENFILSLKKKHILRT